MSQFAILRFAKIKSASQGHARLQHNRRVTDCPTANKEFSNKVLYVSEESREYRKKTFREIFKEKVGNQKVRKNAVLAVEAVMTFSPGAVAPGNIQPWATESAKWLIDLFGKENVIDACVHLDEKTPHIHAFVIPIDENGKLNARAFLGGTNNKMVALQSSYADAMRSFGLERGISRELTKAKHKSSLSWHAENAEKEAALEAYKKVFGTEKEWDMDKVIKFFEAKKDIQKKNPLQSADIESIKRSVFDDNPIGR